MDERPISVCRSGQVTYGGVVPAFRRAFCSHTNSNALRASGRSRRNTSARRSWSTAIGPGGAEVQAGNTRIDRVSVLSEPVHLVLRYAELEILGQFETDPTERSNAIPAIDAVYLNCGTLLPKEKVGVKKIKKWRAKVLPKG